MRTFFAARGVEPASIGAAQTDGPLTDAGSDAADEGDTADEGSLLQRLAAMTIAQRVVRAMKGSREERAILIRDPNKLVSAAVLSQAEW